MTTYLGELFILFAASAFRKLSSIYVFSYFPIGFEGRIWDLIVSVPDHCLSFYFAIQIFNGSYDARVDVVFPHSCPQGFVPYPVKCLLEVYEDMVEILLILRLNICSVVLLLALKPAYSSAMISSACGWGLFRMIFNMTLLGWLIRLMVL